MSIKILSELRISRPPTDICVMQEKLYVATKGKRVFFTSDKVDGLKSILFSSQVSTLASSGTVLYCGCSDGMLYGLSQAHKTVLRANVDTAGIMRVVCDKVRGDIFVAACNKKVVQLGENSIIKNVFYGYDSPVVDIDISANGMLSSVSQNNQDIKIVNTNTKAPKHTRLPCGFAEVVHFISNEYVSVGTLDGKIHIYKVRGLELVGTVDAPAGICSMYQYKDKFLIVGFLNATAALYRLSDSHLDLIESVNLPGIPIAFASYKDNVAVAVSREQQMGRWEKMKSGKNRILFLRID